MALGLSLRITNITAKIAAVVTTGLQMWHKMTADTWTGSDRLPDSSDNTNTAALYTGRGFDFDGVNDDIGIGDVSELDFERTDTFSVSFYYNSTTVTPTIIVGKFDDSSNRGWAVFTASTGATHLILRNTITTNSIKVTGPVVNDGAWHHVVYTYDGSSTAAGVNVYVDGALGSISTDVDNLSATIVTSASATIGSRNEVDLFYPGELANIKIFDIELSAGQVSELYANPEQVLPTGATAANLVGWWPMADGDSSGIVLDGSGNGNNGTISGATEVFSLPSPVNQPALKGSNIMMSWDNVDDYVNCGTDSSLSPVLNDFIMEATFMIPNIPPTSIFGICGQSSTNSGEDRYGIYVNLTTGYLTVFMDDSATGNLASTPANNVCDGNKHIVIATFDRDGNLSVDLDGSVIDTLDISSYSAVDVSPTRDFLIGGYYNFGAIFPFEGVIYEVKHTVNSVLVGHWQNTGNTAADWVDLSSTGNDGTVNGSPGTIYIPEGTTAGEDLLGATITNANTGEIILKVDGYTETADDATLDITDELTLEAWVKPFSVATEQTIIGKDLAYALKLTSGAKPAFSKYTTTETETATTSTTLSVDTWYHLAATYDGVNVRLYINGAIDTTTAVSGAIDTNASVLLTGALTSSTEQFDGYIDSAKVYDGTVKSADEILQNYNAEIADHS